jgi:integrase
LLFRQTKNDEPRQAWLHGEALRLLTEHAKVRPIDSDQLVFPSPTGTSAYDYLTPFKTAAAAAKLHNFRFHDLRHSAATYLAREGATEAQLRAIGGWKSGVVRKYVHIAAEDAKEVTARMNKKMWGEP